MALPMAVARCIWNLSIAATRSSRLRVGGCTTWAEPANATMPTLTERGSSVRKALAAFCEATSRFGLTSVARMLPETSIARMMVSCVDGSVITANGRDAANSIAAMASRNSTGGMCRRQPMPVPIASLTMDRLAYRSVSFFLRLSSHR